MNSIMYLYYKVKSMFVKPVETAGEVVDKVDWATKELEEAEKSLVVLEGRLQAGVDKMEEAIQESKDIIKRHQEILEKATNKRSDFMGKRQKVRDVLSTMNEVKE